MRTIYWYANSQRQFEIENQLLNLIISLETLLTPRDGNPIGTAIAEGLHLARFLAAHDIPRKREHTPRMGQHRDAVEIEQDAVFPQR